MPDPDQNISKIHMLIDQVVECLPSVREDPGSILSTTREVETGAGAEVPGNSQLRREFHANLGYMRPSLKNKANKQQQ